MQLDYYVLWFLVDLILIGNKVILTAPIWMSVGLMGYVTHRIYKQRSHHAG